MKQKLSIIVNMKMLYLFILLLFFAVSCGGYSKQEVPKDGNAKVIICTGHYSKSFHSHECRGLKNCGGDIVKISLGEAKEMRRKPCGYCYK